MGTHGGRRPGAGNKPKAITELKAAFALELLTRNDAGSLWDQLIQSDDERIRMDALKYLCDRAFGKAKQLMDVNLEGRMEVGRVVVNL